MQKMHASIFKDDKNIPSFLEKSLPFTLNTLSGKTISSNDLSGKVIVLNFWDLACSPCIMEMPELNELVKKYKNNPDVVFFAPTLNEKTKLKEFVKRREFLYEITYDAKAIFEDFALKGWPWHLIINPKGEIMMKQLGSNPNIKTHLIETIEAALKEK
jgi:thiol-disulfide isomerase/thioredoxin